MFIGEAFSSSDNEKSARNCTHTFKGAWWYPALYQNGCSDLYLNGFYTNTATTALYEQGLRWKFFATLEESLQETWMGLRCGT